MLLQAVRYLPHDRDLWPLVVTTLRLGFEATAVALVVGLPCACAIGLGRARLSRWGLVLANAGLGLPPIGVGVYLVLLISGVGTPWGDYWVGTINGMVLAQTILALPIVVAVVAISIRSLPDGLIDQARAFGARGWRLWGLALREARIGVMSAVILALCSAFGEVGAVGLLAGYGSSTTTLAVQVIQDRGKPDIPAAVEHTLVLLVMMLVLGLTLAFVQHADGRPRSAVLGD